MASRTVLIKATLSSIPSHVMQFITLPIKITKEIDRIQRNFLWGTTQEKRKIHMIRWEVVTKAKVEGGLGIQKASVKNKAALASLAWGAYTNTNTLCARVLIHKNCNMSRPANAGRYHGSSKSPTWRAMLSGWETCTKASRWIVNKGNRVNFFNDTWIPNQPANRHLVEGPLTQSDLLVKVDSIYNRGAWDTSSLSFDLPPHIHNSIKLVFIPSVTTKEDTLVWALTSNGKFSQSSAYSFIHNSAQSGPQGDSDQFKWLWKMQTPNKIKFFIWTLTHRRLPTRALLSSMGINCPTRCHYCNAEQEDIENIFFLCPNAAQFWNAIRSKSTSPPPSNPLNNSHLWQTVWQALKGEKFNEYLDWAIIIPFCLWHIWLTRNNNVFNNKKDPINASNTMVKASEYQLLKCNSNTRCTHQIMLKWEPPQEGCFKLNTDGAAKGKNGIGGAGGILRNHNGSWMLGYMENIPYTSTLGAEFRALLRGLQLAEQNKFLPLQIDTDSSEIIGMLAEGNLIFDPLICECRLLIQRMGSVVVRHSFREQNRVADALAKEA
ncbi:putative ribonuclease h protein, partial [Nicotiana attenuata]